jgi:FixJ family two-component response regulator
LLDNPLIAIVDDDDDVRISIESLLRSFGYAVRGFPSAELFLDSFVHDRPDCVITDIQMPGLNGIELLRRVVASGSAPPVILITAYPDQTLRQHARSAGAHDFLSKPFDEAALIACLDSALGGVASPT